LLPDAAKTTVAALGRQALHAHLLGIDHPTTHEHMVFRSELSSDLADLKQALGKGTIVRNRRYIKPG